MREIHMVDNENQIYLFNQIMINQRLVILQRRTSYITADFTITDVLLRKILQFRGFHDNECLTLMF